VLWRHLRNGALNGLKFRRQHQLGTYIADFFCSSAGLVVEVDGSQHFEPDAQRYDKERTTYLESRGLRVLRVTTVDVLDRTEHVLQAIVAAVDLPSP
jgi:very-short-patch-repair endonuclease